MAVQEVVIKISGDDKELDSTIKKLEQLGTIDKKNAKQFEKTSKEVQAAQKKTQEGLEKTDNKLSKVTSTIKQMGAAMIAAFAIKAIVGNAIQTITEFDESVANLRKTTGLSAKAARDLADQIRKIDTRTSVTSLLELATAAGRLGLKGKDVIDFAKAADKTFVALGDSLEGSAEDIALTLGKLAASFNLEKEFGISESIERIGSALNVLGANSKATEGPIVDFTKRLAGVAAQANISVTDVAALGALFDSTGQSIEVAATTLNVLLPAIGKDVQKFARVAGVNIEEFTKLVETDAVEALKLVALGARSSQEGLVGLSETLESFGVDSARAASIVGILSNNVDELTRLQALAAKGMKENTSLTDEFNIKNNTLSASTAKLGKAYDNFILDLDNGDGVLSQTLIGLADLATSILEGRDSLEKSTNELIKSNSAFAAQERRVNSLLKEYETLTLITDRNTAEQERLLKVIQALGKEIPTAITGFNDLGEAVIINTGIIKENLEVQKEAQRIRSKEQVKELREEIEKHTQSIADNTKELRDGTEFIFVANGSRAKLRKEIELGSKRILENQENNILLKDSIIQTTKQIKELGGVLTDEEKKVIGVTKAIGGKDEGNVKATLDLAKAQLDLVEAKEKDLKAAKESVATNDQEQATKNKLIQTIENQIKALRSLGIETDEEAKKRIKKEEDLINLREKNAKIAKKEIDQIENEFLKAINADGKARIELGKIIAETEEEKIQAVRDAAAFEIEIKELTAGEILLIEEQTSQKITEIRENGVLDRAKIEKEATDDAKEQAQELSNFITFLSAETAAGIEGIRQISRNKEEQRFIDREFDIRKQLDFDLENTKLTEEQKVDLQQEADDEITKIKQERAEADKKQAIFNTILNTAQGIVAALASVPPNVPLSIVIAATGAIQLATIESQPIPKFAEGTLSVEGGVEGKDSVLGMLMPGESIIPTAKTKKHKAVIKDIFNDKFYENYMHRDEVNSVLSGGFAQNVSNSMNFNDENILTYLQDLKKSNKKSMRIQTEILANAMKQTPKFRY